MRKTALFITLSLLLGCMPQSTNPLLTDEAISSIQNAAIGVGSLSDVTFESDCKAYLLGSHVNTALQKRCDKRIETLFNRFKNQTAFQDATLTDMHDTQLWQHILTGRQ